MEEHDKPQFSSQPSNQSYAHGYPLTPVGPAGNNPITVPTHRFPARASRCQRNEYEIEAQKYVCTSIMKFFLIPTVIFVVICAVINHQNAYHTIKFRMDSFSVSHLNITTNQISGNWTIGMSLGNTSPRVNVVYEEFEASVFYARADEFLSRGNLTSFIQGPRNQTLVYVKPVGWLEGLNKFDADSIAEDISVRGIVDFDVKLRVKAKYILRLNIDPECKFDIVCKGIQVKFSSSSSTKNGTGAAVVIPELTIHEHELGIHED